ncbi:MULTISPECIES: flagellar motor switch phosphatase FliY [Clostridium]|uniref:Flagellar motor switch phosphatase FliY n=1 Tax=Clostridium cibarium TaxID=2762247 RepID=A0ABR8PP10_9CLOT|nr:MULTISPECIES: flagellar motor switch phosphatase FliY [Clostridium]MBD7909865.1 flagellar motor switch phosphatase FliY [Clostridium cibarium]
MSNGFLSQDEIDSLLGGGDNNNGSANEDKSANEEGLTDIEKDLLGEIGNISMGSASTALYQIINQKVNITTPVVTVTTLNEMKDAFEIPNIVLDVEYREGIVGRNILVIRTDDAAVIANLMMGGDGKPESHELTELEISAVSEAMNQMIGSAATSMATMFSRKVDISPPVSRVWSDKTEELSDEIPGDDKIVRVNFNLTIGDLVDSNIMQILPVETAKKIVSIMMGKEEANEAPASSSESRAQERPAQAEPVQQVVESKPIVERPAAPVEVHQASFEPLGHEGASGSHQNIDLILDVPLDISVVLGRTRKSIKDILSLGTGSLIELDRLAEEPVEILVNGKRIAFGEVVVVDENFGVRITSIVSSSDRIKSLK